MNLEDSLLDHINDEETPFPTLNLKKGNDFVFFKPYLDVSNRDKFKNAAEEIIKICLPDIKKPKSYTPSMTYLLLVLTYQYKNHPKRPIAISFDSNHTYYKRTVNSKGNIYNPNKISTTIIDCVKALDKHGLIDFKRGNYFRAKNDKKPDKTNHNSKGSYYSRILGNAETESNIIVPFNLESEEFSLHEKAPLVLKNKKYKDGKRKLEQYSSTNRTAKKSTQFLKKYNSLIKKSRIDVNLDRYQLASEQYTHRIFNDTFSLGGRFYGGFWTQMPSKDRQHITINGNKTVEVDCKGQHIHMLYRLVGQKCPLHDPYQVTLPNTIIEPRRLIKAAFLRMLNTNKKSYAWSSLKKHYEDAEKEYEGKKKNKEEMKEHKIISNHLKHIDKAQDFYINVSDPICRTHPHIQFELYKGHGLAFQYEDSEIAMHIMESFLEKGIPVLCVHDSFIIEAQHEELLKTQITNSYRHCGHENNIPILETK